MSKHRTSRRPCVGPFNKAVHIIPALALGLFGTVALSQTNPGSWVELAQTNAELRGPAYVIDGDTLDIHDTRIRISGIDAPESKQICQDAGVIPYACGMEATQALIRWIGTETVTCTGGDQDRYGRIIAQCSVAGADLGAFMVENGHAMAYRRFSTAYISAEIRARRSGLGMWQGTFIAPWDWRRGQR